MDWSQYAADFSLMSSMLRKAPWPGPNTWPDVVPRTIRGDTFVTQSWRGGGAERKGGSERIGGGEGARYIVDRRGLLKVREHCYSIGQY
jgi:hypothetical protein